ncbi:MAG TPA: Clp protease N-terminal domain-containing protein, partial [Terriglobia bacterium]|nr:Clp protease N-terminal domain-containing protein [Terriglobia bacterium]
NRFLRGGSSVETIRKEVERRVSGPREKVPTSVDLPLSAECKRVLAYAQEEAERLSHQRIGAEHLLAGLLREEGSLAAQILGDRGVSLSVIREELGRAKQEPDVTTRRKPTPLSPEFSRDLTQEAADDRNDPLIGREHEMDQMVEVLCRRSKNNPVLVGEPGVGKAAMVKGLAQRIVESKVPPGLADRRIVALFLSSLMAGTRRSEEKVVAVIGELTEVRDVIVFVEELFVPAGREGLLDAANILRPPIARGELRCIASATQAEYQASLEKEPWLDRHFHAIAVPAPDETDAIKILFGIRDRYEKFHGVTYTDEALECAVRHSNRYLPLRSLPDKAIDLIDEAGACVKVRPQLLPEEVIESQRRIRFVKERMEIAIANHEFEKARLYSDEVDKETHKRKLLDQQYQIERSVTRKDIEEVIARWTGIPASSIGRES